MDKILVNYRRHPNIQEARERVLNFLNHQARSNQNHKEIPWEPTREGQNQNKNLMRVPENWNAQTWLVAVETGTTTLESYAVGSAASEQV